jgi:release factor glutamine methyltransferase
VSDERDADWTVQKMLGWMAKDLAALGVSSPRLDAELLLSHALGCDRVRLYMDMPRALDAAELAAIKALVVRRRKREPVAYILGRREFYLRSFEVTHDVLIPRPETEVLVDRALEALPAREGGGDRDGEHDGEGEREGEGEGEREREGEREGEREREGAVEGEGAVEVEEPVKALDLCTGSGAVAISLALERPQLVVDATDVSEAALAVARRNAAQLGASERVRFFAGDLFDAVRERGPYALIVANPPYVGEAEWPSLAPELAHEPRLALLAGHDGLDVLRRLCAEVADFLAPGGVALFELGMGQADAVRALLEADARLHAVQAHKDLAGIERIVQARRAG